MNLKDIDKLFNDNQHQFDKMPSDKLWERLEEKLDATPSMWEEKPQKKLGWLRYVAAAAVILVMMVPAIYLMNNAPTKSSDLAMEQPAMYDATEATGNSREDKRDSEREAANKDVIALGSEVERDLKSSEKIAEVEKKEEEKIIAANETIRTKDKSAYTSKPKPTKSFNNNNQQNKTRSIETPNPVAATPIPSSKDRSLKATRPNPPSKPSMTADADIAIEEEVMEMEADDAGETLDEVSITAYKSRQTTAKAATPEVKATFDITDTDGVYAYARYNADFQTSHFSNMLPYDNFGDERMSQSTLELESAKEMKPSVAGSSKKKSKSNSRENIRAKRSASKEVESDNAPATPPSLGFLTSLEGNWSLFSNDLTFQETWKSMPNGTLLGTATTLQNGISIFKEDISINPLQGDKMVYTIHHPTNTQTLTYQLRTSETSVDNENYLIFDNLQNDFPRTITYRLMNGNDMLKITFEGQKEGKPIQKELILNRF